MSHKGDGESPPVLKPLPRLSRGEFERFRELIYVRSGIHLREHKQSMLEARLRKRLRALGLEDFAAYVDYLFDKERMQDELVHLIDVVTTNKTDFFREPAHFDYLSGTVLPELVRQGVGIERPLRLWSAGCSTGKEPYTLAMVLSEFARERTDFRFGILGSDVSTQALERARLAIYPLAKAAPIPDPLKKRYLLRSRDRDKPQVRIVPELRAQVRFRRINFVDADFGLDESFDILFCRNVIIYFDRATQERFLSRLCAHLLPGRYLFMGHSETLNGMNLPLVQVAPSVYRKQGGAT